MKILVVDDVPLMRHVLINMLRNLNYLDIVEATDGIQAFTLLKKQRNNYTTSSKTNAAIVPISVRTRAI